MILFQVQSIISNNRLHQRSHDILDNRLHQRSHEQRQKKKLKPLRICNEEEREKKDINRHQSGRVSDNHQRRLRVETKKIIIIKPPRVCNGEEREKKEDKQVASEKKKKEIKTCLKLFFREELVLDTREIILLTKNLRFVLRTRDFKFVLDFEFVLRTEILSLFYEQGI